jgi:hypothetical protein
MNENALREEERAVSTSDASPAVAEDTERVWRNRRNIKAFQTRAGLLRYLFFEFHKIRYFGNVTHIFLPRILPLGVQLSRDVGVTFGTYLQPWAAQLNRTLSAVLGTGWRLLDKKEYNLIVILKKLCEKIGKTDFALLDYSDMNLVDRLRSLEMLFLVLHYRAEYRDILYSAIKRAVVRIPSLDVDAAHAGALARRILSRDDDLPSLYNFLLGMNMLKYRRHFELRDLIHANCGEMVSARMYECGAETQREIDLHIEDCKKSLLSLYRKKLEIARLDLYLPREESGDVDFKILEYFYESIDRTKKRSYIGDQEDVVGFTANLLNVFVSSFENILNGRIYIPGVGKVEIFEKGFFQLDLARTSYLIEKLGKASYLFQSPFSLERYLLMLQPGKAMQRPEVEAKQLIDEGIALLHGIGVKLESVLRLRIPDERSENVYVPLDPSVLSGKSFHLPYEERVIRYKSGLGGKTVGEALTFIARICFLSGMTFHYPGMYGLLGEREAIDRDIRENLQTLARIAQPDVLQELKNLDTAAA